MVITIMKNKLQLKSKAEAICNDFERVVEGLNGEFFRDKTVLITGASGLIGAYFLSYFMLLNNAGKNVNVIACIHTSTPEHIKDFIQIGSMSQLSIDLADFRDYKKIPEADIIIHAAGYAQPSLFMKNPANTLMINVAATEALLKRLRPDGTFLFLSSSEIYCGLSLSPSTEDMCGTTTPYHPRSSYIEGKRAGEAVCAAYRKMGVRTISVRLGDVYGPGTSQNDARALNTFIQRALEEKAIRLRDHGRASRTYCYISDAVESMLNVITDGSKQIYNVGSSLKSTIKELALLIGQLAGAEVIFPGVENAIDGAPPELIMDLNRLQSEFPKSDYISLREGLIRTIAWQRILYFGIEK
jgi:UDP-glucuronate decarboxylase